MKIKNIREFRTWVKNDDPDTNGNNKVDENFLGLYDEHKTKSGFFKIIHGKIDNGFDNKLKGLLNLAQDTQGVYEFIQNAIDCESTTFGLFYDDDNLIAFNDGLSFKKENVIAILNEGDSNKSEGDIGRFGVGFKIIHRLVGEHDGFEEIKRNEGPIIFSWNNKQQITNFIDDEELNLEFDDSIDSESPWLFKILLTCFPTQLNDTVYDLKNNETKELLKKSEINNLVKFIKYLLVQYNFDIKEFSRGSLFYIKLGKNKNQKIKDDLQKLEKGIQYTLNFLQHSTKNRPFSKILLQSDVLEVNKLNTEIIEIDSTNEIYRQIIDYNSTTPIQIIFGYEFNPQNELLKKKTSNFFKFFPMEKETVGFNFIIHSDAFIIEKSRRELQGDSRNNLLLNYLISELKVKLSDYRVNNIEKYRQIFLSILLSNKPEQTHEHFSNLYQDLVSITKDFIPNDEDGVSSSTEIVAKNENVNISFKLSDWGIKKKFFHWQGEGNKNLLYITVLKKYKIEKWDLITCISNADEVSFNNWFVRLSANSQSEFLAELEVSDLKDVSKLCLLKLFKFSDNEFYSANDDVSKIDEVDSRVKPKNLVFHSTSTFTIKSELEKLEQLTSEIDIEKNYPKLFNALGLNLKQANLYKEIVLTAKVIKLNSQEKKNVFQTFSSQSIPELLTEGFFQNSFGIEKLNNLLKPSKEYPSWLSKFSILDSEYYPELDANLIKDDVEIFSFIYRNWTTIITLEEVKQDVKAFYSKVESYYLLSANKKEALTNLPIIFVNDTIGFKKSNEVYFHSTLKDCNYPKIQNAIKTIFELEIPSKDALEFLSKDDGVFQVTDDKNLLATTLNSKTPIELAKDDVIEFLNFSISKIREEFFNQFIITEKTKDIYVIEHRGNDTFQVSQIKGDVINLIQKTENLNRKYKILPVALKDDFGYSTGILTWKNNFYSSLLKDKELLIQPTEIFKYLFDTTSQKEYINGQSEILIPINSEINIESSVYKILEWCSGTEEHKSVFSDDEIPLVRNKFKLKVGEEKFEVSNSKGEIIIAGITFTLASLLPNEQIDKKNEHTSNFLKQYSAKGLKEENLKTFFGIGEDISAESVFIKLEAYKGKALNNKQVEFLLLYSVEKPDIDLSEFFVETLLGLQALKQLFYTKTASFLKPTHILSDKYSDINIQLCNGKILSEYSFNFNEKNELDTSLFKEQLNDEEKISLLEFVFGVWKTDKEKFASFNIANICNLLGFRKNEIFLKDDYTVADEKLPSFYRTFLGEDVEKISFSIAIGINDTSNSAIELRKYFENNSPEKLFENIQEISPQLLHNTLHWLREKEIVLSKVFHLEALKIIYAQIVPTDNTPFLFIDSFNTENNLCYKIKQAETDNYLIGDSELAKLHDYEIPLKRIFEIQEKSKKNLVKQNFYPLSFGFNTTFKQVHIPDSIITDTDFQNLPEWQEPYFTEWKKSNNNTITVYLFDGEIPRHIIFENEPINLNPDGFEFESNGVYYVSNDSPNILNSLESILPKEIFQDLLMFKGRFNYESTDSIEDVFEGMNLSDDIRARLKTKALDIGGNLTSSEQIQHNLIAKIALIKHLGKESIIELLNLDDSNNIQIENELFKVFSSRSEFAHIHPTALLQLKNRSCKIAIFYGSKVGVKIFSTIQSLFDLNENYIFEYQAKGDIEKIIEFLEKNNIESYRYLLINPAYKNYTSSQFQNRKTERNEEASNIL